MILLILSILLIGIIILLCKKYKISKKFIIISIIVLLISIFVISFFIFNIIPTILYKVYALQPTITQEERDQAVATLEYVNILGIDAMSYETYYIFQNNPNQYHYYRTSSQITIAGPSEEKINKKGNINNRRTLEKIIHHLEKKITSIHSEYEYISIYYHGTEINEEQLLNELFP